MMRYIDRLFTYLLTYLLAYLLTYFPNASSVRPYLVVPLFYFSNIYTPLNGDVEYILILTNNSQSSSWSIA